MLRVAQKLTGQHLLCDGFRFLFRLANHDPLASRQAIGFHNNGSVKMCERIGQLIGGTADSVMRGRQMMPLHEFFGEHLAGFQLRRPLRRTKDSHAAAREFIYQAKAQWNLRADDGEIGLFGDHHSDKVIEIFLINGNATSQRRNAAIAGRANHFLHTWRSGAIAQTSACSRPPPPITRTFMRAFAPWYKNRVSVSRAVCGDGAGDPRFANE